MNNDDLDLKKQKNNQSNWEHKVLEQLVFASLKEQRKTRRWNIFFKLVFIIYIALFIVALWPTKNEPKDAMEPHASIININGVIMPGSKASADNLATSLRRAFEDKNTKGVILRINSPGGAPVEADYVYNEIMRLRKKYPDTKVYAVCSDVCASGAYYIASAADDIYANPSSLVGSIGVMINGFGFVDTMKKLGIERRLLIAGENKGILDPFSPMTDQQKQYIQRILDETHQQFIQAVEKGRGKRLDLNNPNLFSGLIWSGIDAKKIGLIDGFKSTGGVMRDILHTKYHVDYTRKQGFLERFADKLGTTFTQSFLAKIYGYNDLSMH